MGAWRARVARDDKGKLHFVYARYDTSEPRQRCGMVGISLLSAGDTIEVMKCNANELVRACEEPVIAMTEDELEPDDDEDDDD